MKKIIMVVIAAMMTLGASAQNVIYVWKNGTIIGHFDLSTIDSIGLWSKPLESVNGHEMVDMGLPSGTQWATCNVGANNPEEYGAYYAWGMIQQMYPNADANYSYMCTPDQMGTNADPLKVYIDGPTNISGSQHDAATYTWQAPWALPTYAQCQELIANTTYEQTIMNGVTGWQLTSKINSNTLFFPAAGWYSNDSPAVGTEGHYLCGSPSSDGAEYMAEMWFHVIGGYGINSGYGHPRGVGNTIRPVINRAPIGPIPVDMGLPSNTKWCSCNLGANTPEESGDYYAWGMTTISSDYSWGWGYMGLQENECGSETDPLQEYVINGSSIAGSEYDVAYLRMGGQWRMPTIQQFSELIDPTYTSFEYILYNNVEGIKITSLTNGNSIFIPSVGWYMSDNFHNSPFFMYWSASPHEDGTTNASICTFWPTSNSINEYSSNCRCYGLPIRPVLVE